MGKIVKYCSSCDEGFAEKFGFCPDCGAPLQAFEMNPVEPPKEAIPAEPIDATPVNVSAVPAPRFLETEAEEVDATPIEVEATPASFDDVEDEPEAAFDDVEDEPQASFDDGDVDEEFYPDATNDVYDTAATGVTYVAGAGLTWLIDESYRESRGNYVHAPSGPAAPAFVGGSNFLGLSDESARANSNYQYQDKYGDVSTSEYEKATDWDYSHPGDGGFYVTVVQDSNQKQRNVLLLGAAGLVLFLAVGGWGVSLFQKDLGVGAIGSENSLAYLLDEVPMPVEEEPKKEKDKGGGGGGGGKKEQDPVNEGDMPNQTKNPLRPPDPKVFRSDNFELKTPPPSTQGNKTFEQKFGQWGDPNSRFQNLSNGPGSGGGMGTGNGLGAGSGNGSGAGSGSGSGYGGGNGNGNGNGTGDGDGGAPPAAVAKVTQPYKITSQPKATYTDAARSNNVQGAVRLKITLLANGQVGSIVPVTRLPDGLTEKAIAAAKMIRFEPKMVNGVPVSVVVTREYTFTIY